MLLPSLKLGLVNFFLRYPTSLAPLTEPKTSSAQLLSKVILQKDSVAEQKPYSIKQKSSITNFFALRSQL